METSLVFQLTAQWDSDLPSVCCSLPWDSQSGSVPASLSPTKSGGRLGSERGEIWNFSSAILALGTAPLAAAEESGGSSFFWLQTSVSGGPGLTTVCYKRKKKDSVFYQEMALKESLLVTAPHCSHLSVNAHTCVSPDTHKHTCTYLTHSVRSKRGVTAPLLYSNVTHFTAFTHSVVHNWPLMYSIYNTFSQLHYKRLYHYR